MARYLYKIRKIIVFSLFLSFLPLMQSQAVVNDCIMPKCANWAMDMPDEPTTMVKHTKHSSHCGLCYALLSDVSLIIEYMSPLPNNQISGDIFSYITPLITPPPII